MSALLQSVIGSLGGPAGGLYGPEIIPNPSDFSQSNWTLGPGMTLDGVKAVGTNVELWKAVETPAQNLEDGVTYRAEIDLESISGAVRITPRIGVSSADITTPGTAVFQFVSTAIFYNMRMVQVSAANTSFVLTRVSMKKVLNP